MAQTVDPRTFQVQATPQVRPSNVVSGEHWRISLLTDSLVRFEWSDSGEFEDRPTQMALNRDLGEDVAFSVEHSDGRVLITTAALSISYDGKPFSKEGLSVVVGGVSNSQFNTWHYGDRQPGNLRGTARTLDEGDGEIPLGLGVISHDGWALIDDSASNVLVPAGDGNPFGTWVAPREHAETDLYFFGYGHRYIQAVQDFYRLTGPTPLLPRWALGNWWSRYYRYSQPEYLELMDRFKREGIPFTTAVIDMDWHRVDDVDPKFGSGWTGYSWNRKLFPDPEGFLASLRERGLKTTLNVHPRDGVRAFEDDYREVAERVGIDPDSERAVEFDLTNPDFMDAYFAMHHRLEGQGVDFWWLDWQQGGVTRMPGLDPLWMLNHLHYLDSGRDGRWPLTFSRYAGPGSHRYPVGFSGDTVISWKSLKFQPYFTATASNIGYGWWSHDIGGHMFGYRDDELEARWYQLGAFSPINRLHSSSSPFSGKEPWNFPGEVSSAMVAALRLRHEMLPYLHTMNWRASGLGEGRPVVEPMYWQAPEVGAAYDVPDEFRFGTELLVAPIVDPGDRDVKRGAADVWLPQGEWFDFFDGRRYVSLPSDGRSLQVWRALDRIPVFAKAGGIVPMQEVDETGEAINDIANPKALRVLVFPGADGAFTMREDGGDWASAGEAGRSADTSMGFVWRAEGAVEAGASVFTVAPVAGDVDAVPGVRDWTVVFRGVAPVEAAVATADIAGQEASAAVDYDPATLSLSVTVHDVPTDAELRVEIAGGLRIADNPMEQDAFEVLMRSQMQFRTKEMALQAVREQGVGALAALHSFERSSRHDGDFWVSHMPDGVAAALTEVLTRA